MGELERATRRWPRGARVLLAAVGAASTLGCASPEAPAGTRASASPSTLAPGSASTALAAASTPPADTARARALLALEARGTSDGVREEDLTTRDVGLRRLAVRALARIADERAVERLLATLADEDGQVVAWSAYGLGCGCAQRRPEITQALALRAASWWMLRSGAEPARAPLEPKPLEALADALARCGGADAEHVLRGWLEAPTEVAEAGAYGLGRLAERRGALEESSLIALLDSAPREGEGPGSALMAFGQVAAVSGPVERRLLEVAGESAARGGPAGRLAIVALSRAGAGAVPALAKLAEAESLALGDRAELARSLARLGPAGQKALAALVVSLARAVTDEQGLRSDGFGVLLQALEVLEAPSAESQPTLERLAEWAPPATRSALVERRIVQLRCAAAAALAGTASLAKRLLACAPEGSVERGLALARVLDRAPITKRRRTGWLELVRGKPARIREAALELLLRHPELDDVHRELAVALRAAEAGVVASAARVLAERPELSAPPTARASPPPPPVAAPGGTAAPSVEGTDRGLPRLVVTESLIAPDADTRPRQALVSPTPAVSAALVAALQVERPPDAIAVRVQLIRAAGALQVLSLKPKVERACEGANGALRAAAEEALHRFGQPDRHCSRRPAESAAPEPGAPPSRLVTLTFVTDTGRPALTLDPSLAPRAVSRIVELAKSEFYNGLALYRVVAGSVVHFGDRTGDGYGGAGREPLRSENSPIPFGAWRVGVALSGPDTGSSQLFVTLTASRHLDGDYPLVGWADAAWASVVQGDRIEQVIVAEAP